MAGIGSTAGEFAEVDATGGPLAGVADEVFRPRVIPPRLKSI